MSWYRSPDELTIGRIERCPCRQVSSRERHGLAAVRITGSHGEGQWLARQYRLRSGDGHNWREVDDQDRHGPGRTQCGRAAIGDSKADGVAPGLGSSRSPRELAISLIEGRSDRQIAGGQDRRLSGVRIARGHGEGKRLTWCDDSVTGHGEGRRSIDNGDGDRPGVTERRSSVIGHGKADGIAASLRAGWSPGELSIGLVEDGTGGKTACSEGRGLAAVGVARGHAEGQSLAGDDGLGSGHGQDRCTVGLGNCYRHGPGLAQCRSPVVGDDEADGVASDLPCRRCPVELAAGLVEGRSGRQVARGESHRLTAVRIGSGHGEGERLSGRYRLCPGSGQRRRPIGDRNRDRLCVTEGRRAAVGRGEADRVAAGLGSSRRPRKLTICLIEGSTGGQTARGEGRGLAAIGVARGHAEGQSLAGVDGLGSGYGQDGRTVELDDRDRHGPGLALGRSSIVGHGEGDSVASSLSRRRCPAELAIGLVEGGSGRQVAGGESHRLTAVRIGSRHGEGERLSGRYRLCPGSGQRRRPIGDRNRDRLCVTEGRRAAVGRGEADRVAAGLGSSRRPRKLTICLIEGSTGGQTARGEGRGLAAIGVARGHAEGQSLAGVDGLGSGYGQDGRTVELDDRDRHGPGLALGRSSIVGHGEGDSVASSLSRRRCPAELAIGLVEGGSGRQVAGGESHRLTAVRIGSRHGEGEGLRSRYRSRSGYGQGWRPIGDRNRDRLSIAQDGGSAVGRSKADRIAPGLGSGRSPGELAIAWIESGSGGQTARCQGGGLAAVRIAGGHGEGHRLTGCRGQRGGNRQDRRAIGLNDRDRHRPGFDQRR